MKFKLLSDLHLEFYGARPFYRQEAVPIWEPEVTDEDAETVLLLAGDIHVGHRAQPWIEKMCERFQFVVYILGNHEFYNDEINHVIKFWREVDMPDNFTFLENDVIHFGTKVRVIGGVLWTQVTDPHMIWQGPKRMTDYQITTVREHGKVRRMNVQDTNKMHCETANYIRNQLQVPWYGKTIVMTHHLPHPLCVHPQWEGSGLNAFFMTDLDHIIRNFDIDVWCHGHTHDVVDIDVHNTRILCNPMGYHGVKLNQDFKEELIFEL
jgi:Icc-related predicted phosphoesterase